MRKFDLQNDSSDSIVQDNIKHLKELFPDAFTEGGVNFDTLRQLLGDLKVLDEGEEKYGLNWHGKKQARQIALTPSLGTLLPCPEESVDWDNTQNLFIEGDNLEVLKLLQKGYANKVKMIYIDPPYNTGKEFVYPDKFQDNLDTYLKYTGQKDDEGLSFTSNTETGGRKHTNWLNMMYPRLKLARDLLKEDGVIFISIDDNEQANLKKICDEVFGEENFFADLVVVRSEGGGLAKKVVKGHDSLLVYVKNINKFTGILKPKDIRGKIINKDGRDFWIEEDWLRREFGKYGTLPYEEIEKIKGRIKKEEIDNGLESGVYTLIQKGSIHIVGRLRALDEDGSKFYSILKHLNKNGVDDLKKMNLCKIFDFPKPVSLIKELTLGATFFSKYSSDIILDFFAGSSTTAHAVMQLNAEDGGNRRHISVQLPEHCNKNSEAYKAGYKNIADIGKERIRRAAKKIKQENPDYNGDLGFKVFKLASSNIKVWNPDHADLEGSLLNYRDHLVKDRSEQDILYELLLRRGIDLTTPIEVREIANKNIYSIGFGKLITCLDDIISEDDVEDIAAGIIAWQKELKTRLELKVLETHVFFKDSAFCNDIIKTNMVAILSQSGIEHIRSL